MKESEISAFFQFFFHIKKKLDNMCVQTDVYEPNVIMEYFFNINVIFTPSHSSLLELVMDFSTVVWR